MPSCDGGWGLGADCGLHGTCISSSSNGTTASSTCVCDEGWSGHQDFLTLVVDTASNQKDGLSSPPLSVGCSTSRAAAIVAWAVLLALSVFSCLNTYCRRRAIQHQLRLLRRKRLKKAGLRWWQHRPLIGAVVFLPAFFVSFWSLCLLKIIDPQRRLVLIDPATTAFFVAASVSHFFNTTLTLPARVRKIMRKAYLFRGETDRAELLSAKRAREAQWVSFGQVLCTLCLILPPFFAQADKKKIHVVVCVVNGAAMVSMAMVYLVTLIRFRGLMQHIHTLTGSMIKGAGSAGTTSAVEQRRDEGASRIISVRSANAPPTMQNVSRARAKATWELACNGTAYLANALAWFFFASPFSWRSLAAAPMIFAGIGAVFSWPLGYMYSSVLKVKPSGGTDSTTGSSKELTPVTGSRSTSSLRSSSLK